MIVALNSKSIGFQWSWSAWHMHWSWNVCNQSIAWLCNPRGLHEGMYKQSKYSLFILACVPNFSGYRIVGWYRLWESYWGQETWGTFLVTLSVSLWFVLKFEVQPQWFWEMTTALCSCTLSSKIWFKSQNLVSHQRFQVRSCNLAGIATIVICKILWWLDQLRHKTY